MRVYFTLRVILASTFITFLAACQSSTIEVTRKQCVINKSAATNINSGLSETTILESENLLSRLLGKQAKFFELEYIAPDYCTKKDVFEIEKVKDKIALRGSSVIAIAGAFNTYIELTGQGHFSWGGDRALSLKLPDNFNKIRKVSPVELYYQYNFTAHGYTTPYWSWADWERELDLMALNGITHPLIVVGIEEVYRQTFTQFGYSEQAIRDWLVLPAHLPWQLMGNMHSSGKPLSQALIDKRAQLGRKVIDRIKSLGMTAVIPGFYGMVPDDFIYNYQYFNDNENSQRNFVVAQGEWAGGYSRPGILNPNSTAFLEIAKAYYQAVNNVFGKVDYFAADPFHEGGKTKGINITLAAKSIQQSMLDYNPDSVWVLQAWQDNPKDKILAALDKKHALIVDLWGDEDPAWDRDGKKKTAFDGVPWAWLAIQNFGGNTGLTGNLDTITKQFSPDGVFNDYRQSNLIGMGLAMEGIQQNPVVLDLMFNFRWKKEGHSHPFDLNRWVKNYSVKRYGKENQAASKAWKLLLDSVYHSGPFRREGTIESIFTARPSLDAIKASTWGPKYGPYYDEQKLEKAYKLLLDAKRDFADIPTYQYDLIDVSRQVLANKARHLLRELKSAYDNSNLQQFNQLKDSFLALILVQDRLLNTLPDFRLDTWLAKARNFATSEEEVNLLVENAKRIITTWAPIDSDLQDYSHREWAGLLSDYYYPRWQLFLDSVSESLSLGKSKVKQPDLWQWEDSWVKKEYKSPNPSAESNVVVAEEIYNKYIRK